MKHLALTAAFAVMATGALAGNTPLVNNTPTSVANTLLHTANLITSLVAPVPVVPSTPVGGFLDIYDN